MPLPPNFNVINETGITKLSQLYQGSEVKSKQNLEQQYERKVLDLAYNFLVSAIPNDWKTKIVQKLPTETELTGSDIDIGHLKMNISKLKNKNIYVSLTFSHTILTAEKKWVKY